MCGIVGVLGGNIPDKLVLEKARDAMIHRGPDDAGVYYNQQEGIGLGHRRLSIIDLSSAGHQPIADNSGRFVLIFNGEIYNYLEIKEELKNFYQFKTRADTEVLLAAYIKWKEKCLEKLNGMFAFAIWDRRARTLLLARDRLGIKPLYYTIQNDSFYFASEIKAILRLTNIERRLDKQALLDYLSYRYALGAKTMFENINSLLPGYYILVKRREEPKLVKYWDLPVVADKADAGEEEVIKETEKLLKKTVRSHMITDVPLGAYLSGGLDSGLLVALMSEISKEPVKTFSIGFAEKGFNEFEYSRKISRIFQADHHEFILHSRDYFDLMPTVIRFKDAPLSTHNEIALYVLSKQLKKFISVVLSGDGADELFAGYGRIFRSGYDLERIRRLMHSNCISRRDRNTLIRNMKKKYKILDFNSPLEHFLAQYPYLKLGEKRELMNKEFFRQSDGQLLNKIYFQAFFSKIKKLSPSDQYLYVFQKVHLLGPLHRLDTPTMAASVEARVPYVDHKLVEFVSALPLKYKLSWKSAKDKNRAALLNSDAISEKYDITKYLLRKIGAIYLPPEIINRKKMNFPAPLEHWLGKEYNNFAKSILLSSRARISGLFNKQTLQEWIKHKKNNIDDNRGLNLWMLLNIEIWMNEYKVTL